MVKNTDSGSLKPNFTWHWPLFLILEYICDLKVNLCFDAIETEPKCLQYDCM